MRALSHRIALALLVAVAGCAHRPPMAIQRMASPCQQVVPDRTHPLVWIAPDDARDLGHLVRWCQTVGPVVVESPAVNPVPAVADRLAIITWNVHVGGGDLDAIISALRTGEFTDGNAAPDFVLLLQEAHREGHDVPAEFPAGSPLPRPIVELPPGGIRRDVRAVAARAGLHLFYAPAMRNTSVEAPDAPEDRGTAILSTLPLADLQVIELPFERQRRVAQAASIAGRTGAAAAWQLRLVNVQIDTALALTRGGPVAARRRQAEALVDALSRRDLTTPMVLGGDFNTWLGNKEPAIQVMRRAFPATPHARPVTTWRGPLGVHASLDHVFVRGHFRFVTKRLPGRFGSDHYPLLTLVDFS